MSDSESAPEGEFDQRYAVEQLRRSNHPLRRIVKSLYLKQVLGDVLAGPCIDFGCGAGQLLRRLPRGSVGLEVNAHLIESLRHAGLTIRQARAEMADFELKALEVGVFRTLIISHVLEHLENPIAALSLLFSASQRLGVERLIIVVPGIKGYASDHTHRTFIDRAYIEDRVPSPSEGFARTKLSYFPGPWERIGRYFAFHEMKVVFDRVRP